MPTVKTAAIVTALALAGACAPRIPFDYAQQCMLLVQETDAGQAIHETTRPTCLGGHPDDGRGPIRFDFSHLTGEREVEYEYVSHYMYVGDVPIPVYATGTRIVEYGPRFRATCSRRGEQVVLEGITDASEWEDRL